MEPNTAFRRKKRNERHTTDGDRRIDIMCASCGWSRNIAMKHWANSEHVIECMECGATEEWDSIQREHYGKA